MDNAILTAQLSLPDWLQFLCRLIWAIGVLVSLDALFVHVLAHPWLGHSEYSKESYEPAYKGN